MCSAETAIRDLLAGRLGEDATAEIDRHMDGCERCRRLIAALAREDASP